MSILLSTYKNSEYLLQPFLLESIYQLTALLESMYKISIVIVLEYH